MRPNERRWENLTMSDNWMFVGAAFTVTWVVLIGYLVHVHRLLRDARAMLDSASAPEPKRS